MCVSAVFCACGKGFQKGSPERNPPLASVLNAFLKDTILQTQQTPLDLVTIPIPPAFFLIIQKKGRER